MCFSSGPKKSRLGHKKPKASRRGQGGVASDNTGGWVATGYVHFLSHTSPSQVSLLDKLSWLTYGYTVVSVEEEEQAPAGGVGQLLGAVVVVMVVGEHREEMAVEEVVVGGAVVGEGVVVVVVNNLLRYVDMLEYVF